MSDALYEAYVEVGLDTKKLDSGISKLGAGLTTRLSRLGQSASKALNSALAQGLKYGAIGAAAGTAFVVLTTKAAANAQEIKNKYDVVFRGLTKATDKFADEFGKNVGRSVIETKESLANLGDLFKPLGYATEDAAKLAMQVHALGVDLASFSNMADADAIQALQSGLLGESEPLKKFGIVLNETALKSELLAMGLKKVDEASAMQKTQARLNIILRSTTDAQGDAIRSADSLTSRLKGLAGAWTDASAKIGGVFMPAATELTGHLKGLVDWMEKNAGAIKSWGAVLATEMRAALRHLSLVADTWRKVFNLPDVSKINIESTGDAIKALKSSLLGGGNPEDKKAKQATASYVLEQEAQRIEGDDPNRAKALRNFSDAIRQKQQEAFYARLPFARMTPGASDVAKKADEAVENYIEQALRILDVSKIDQDIKTKRDAEIAKADGPAWRREGEKKWKEERDAQRAAEQQEQEERSARARWRAEMDKKILTDAAKAGEWEPGMEPPPSVRQVEAAIPRKLFAAQMRLTRLGILKPEGGLNLPAPDEMLRGFGAFLAGGTAKVAGAVAAGGEAAGAAVAGLAPDEAKQGPIQFSSASSLHRSIQVALSQTKDDKRQDKMVEKAIETAKGVAQTIPDRLKDLLDAVKLLNLGFTA